MKLSLRTPLFAAASLIFAGSFAPPARGQCQSCLASLNLPASANIAIDINTDDTVSQSFLAAALTGLPSGFMADGLYDAWCVDLPALPAPGGFVLAPLYSTYGMVVYPTGAYWNKINWVINHRAGYVFEDVQNAIWQLQGRTPTFPVSAAGSALLAAANANGGAFVPGPGQVVGVVALYNAFGNGPYQNVMIEAAVPAFGTIGDFVWSDTNGNGLQDGAEPGINGVTVQLYDSTDSNLLASTVTANAPAGYSYLMPGAAGYYQFASLPAGAYVVKVPYPQNALGGYNPTASTAGYPGNAAMDSNGSGATVVIPSQNGVDETIDFGFVPLAPVGLTCPAGTGALNSPYSSSLAASGGAGGYTYSILNGNLPAGLTLDGSTGLIHGAPAGFGSFAFTAQVVDARGNAAGTAANSCSIAVAPPPVSLQCSASTGAANSAYSSALLASGGTQAGYFYSITAGSLPAGLTLDASTGLIHGTPTAAGTTSFTAQAVDSRGTAAGAATASCSIAIPQAQIQPLSLTCPTAAGQVNVPYHSTPVVSGGLGPYTYTLVRGVLPTGLSLDAHSGAIDGTPAAAGNFGFGIQVTDSLNHTAVSSCIASCGSSAANWNFNAPTGNLGSSHIFTANGIALTVYGFANAGAPTALYGRNDAGNETGVGIAGAAENEIDLNHFVQLDLSNAIAAGATGAWMTVNSVQSGESYDVYGSNTPGSPGALLLGGQTLGLTPFNMPGYPNYKYIAIRAHAANVLLGAVSFSFGACGIEIIAPVDLQCGSCGGPKVTVNTPYSAQLTATGGTGPYTFALQAGGSLPPGLSLNSATGAITGAPVKAGGFTFVTVVTDRNGGADTATCTITVIAPPLNLTCGTCGGNRAVAGSVHTSNLSAAGGSGGYVYSLQAGSALPPGLSLNPSTGAIAGTPATPGTYTFTTVVKDSGGNTDTATCTITVAASPVNLDCGSCGAGKAYAGTAYSAQLSVRGASGSPAFSIVSGVLPAGLSLSATTGKINGTPTTAGTYTFTSKVVDGNNNSDTQTCTIVVTGRPVNLDCGACGGGAGKLGSTYSTSFAISGGKAPFTYTVASGALPAGLTLNAATGAITGTPTAGGSFTFTTKVSSADGSSDTATCTIAIAGSPVNLDCGACGTRKATIGVAYSATFTLAGGWAPFAYSIQSGALPPGLSLSAGQIAGTPTTAGSYTFTTLVKDSKGNTDTATCTIVVTGGAIDLQCGSCGGAVNATPGTPYSANLTVVGGAGPFTYSMAPGSPLPPGLSLNAATGLISGTPTAAGIYTFTTTVKDSRNATDTATCTILVLGAAIDLECGTCGNSRASLNMPYSSALKVTGGSGPMAFSIVSGSLPPGLSLNAASGVISGAPAAPGNFTFTSQVKDARGKADTATCTLTVTGPPINLDCGSCAAGKAYAGAAYSASESVSNGAGGYTFSIVAGSLPPGLSMNASKGVISGVPAAPGVYTFTAKVVDAKGNSDTATCTIVVAGNPLNLDCGSCGAGKATVNKPYSVAERATGGSGGYTYSLASGSLPAGMTLNPATGQISGTPTRTGAYTFTAKVTDSQGNTDTVTCSIDVYQGGS